MVQTFYNAFGMNRVLWVLTVPTQKTELNDTILFNGKILGNIFFEVNNKCNIMTITFNMSDNAMKNKQQ